MKKRGLFYALVLVLVLGCVFMYLACDNDSSGGDTKGSPIVVLGDSLSSGWNTTQASPTVDTPANAWPVTFSDYVNVPVINVSQNGNTTDEALKKVDNKVLNQKPQIIVVQLGANDFFTFDLKGAANPMAAIQAGVAGMTENMVNIMNKIDDGKRIIYVAKWYNQTVAKQWLSLNYPDLSGDQVVAGLLVLFDGIYTAAVKDRGENVTLMTQDVWAREVWTNSTQPPYNKTEPPFYRDWNPIHPTKEGCAVMAETYLDEMKAYLNEKGLLTAAGKAKAGL